MGKFVTLFARSRSCFYTGRVSLRIASAAGTCQIRYALCLSPQLFLYRVRVSLRIASAAGTRQIRYALCLFRQLFLYRARLATHRQRCRNLSNSLRSLPVPAVAFIPGASRFASPALPEHVKFATLFACSGSCLYSSLLLFLNA